MNARRLLRVAEILDGLPNDPKVFDMSNWKCGTAACAVGHACADPQLKADGLYLFLDSPHFQVTLPSGIDKTYLGWKAVDRFFGLKKSAADLLFDCDRYEKNVDPAVVAARIREFVAANTATV